MSIFWLQQTMADVPTDNSWLCANEALRLRGIKFPKRCNDWRLGRWTAKCAIAAFLGWRVESSFLDNIEIRPAMSGAPEAFMAGQRTNLGVSLSHCAGRAIAALVPSGMAVGCDLERIEPRIDAFVSDYFTPEEQLFVEKIPTPYLPALVTLLWSAKESALKALCQGLRLDTRSISVNIGDGRLISRNLAEDLEKASIQHFPCGPRPLEWRALQVSSINTDWTFYGWWQATSDFVWTVVAGAPLLPPILLSSWLHGGQ
jgi:4'-phosphopantetheinyl transferase